MHTVAPDPAALAWTQFWQVTLVALALGLVVRVACRNRPHLAYLLWMLVVVKALTPPLLASPTGIFSWVLRGASLRVAQVSPLADTMSPTLPNAEPSSRSQIEQDSKAAADEPPSDARIPTTFQPWPRTGAATLLGVWLGGCLALCGYVTAKWVGSRRRWSAASVATTPELVQQLRDLASRLGLRRAPRLLVSRAALGPAVFGIWRPTVLLPSDVVDRLGKSALEPILAHELIHVRRADPAAAMLQLNAQLVWWFHPFVWWANREARRERERACDEEVVTALRCPPRDYARVLLDVLEAQPRRPAAALSPSVGMLGVTARRLDHLLRRADQFHRRTPLRFHLAALAGLVLLLPGAGLAVDGAAPAIEPLASDEGAPVAGPPEPPRSNPKGPVYVYSADGTVLQADGKSAKAGARQPEPRAATGTTVLYGGTVVPPVSATDSPKHRAAAEKLQSLGVGVQRVQPDEGKPYITIVLNAATWQGMLDDLALLADLTNLRQLDFIGNGKGSDLLRGLPDLPYLTLLGLHGAEDDDLAALRPPGDFEWLIVEGDKITDRGLSSLARLRSVRRLFLSQCGQITDEGLAALAQMPTLSSLTIANCDRIHGTGLAGFREHTGLRQLDLANTSVSPTGMEEVGRLTQLESLSLDVAELDGAGLAALARLANLRKVMIFDSIGHASPERRALQLGDVAARHLQGLAELRDITIVEMPMSDAGLSGLARVAPLASLSVTNGDFTTAGLKALSAARNLQKLALASPGGAAWGSWRVSDADLEFLAGLDQLESLWLPMERVTDLGLAKLARLTRLRELGLSGSQITDAGLAQVKALPSLHRLMLNQTAIGDAGVAHLVTLKNLESLGLSGTKITDASLAVLAKLPSLRELYLDRTAITDGGVAKLAALKNLRRLALVDTNVSENALASLRSALPTLPITSRAWDQNAFLPAPLPATPEK